MSRWRGIGRELDLLVHQFGKRGHVAALNYGACSSCALAQITGERLLFKGTDFRHTDVIPVDLRS